MQSAKEAASNIAASAKSGMDKTKATVEEKVERMTAHHPLEKEMATQRKLEKFDQAELNKQAVREHNAAARQQSTTSTTGVHTTTVPLTHGHSTTGHTTTGLNPLHGHGTTGHTTTGLNPLQGHGTAGHTTTGLNPLHGHGTTGHPHGVVEGGAVGSHPIGTTTTTTTNMAPNDPSLGGGYTQTGYGTGTGTGGAYS